MKWNEENHSDEGAPTVLHIRPKPDEQRSIAARATEVDRQLRDAGVVVDSCSDVYRGLARLLARRTPEQPNATRFAAVIVWMGNIGTDEMEFFSLIAGAPEPVQAWVYGDEHLGSRMADAVRLGAAGEWNERIISSLAQPDRDTETAVCSDAPPVDTTPQVLALADPMLEDTIDEIVDRDATAEPDPPNDTTTAPARVPWGAYGDRPMRCAPGANAEPTSPEHVPSIAESTRKTTQPSEPLLTPEELDALLGDDISAIAPQRRTDTLADDSNTNRGAE